MLEFSASRRWALEFKKSSARHVEKGFHIACDDIGAERRLLVYPGAEAWPAAGVVEVTPLLEAVRQVGTR